MFVIKRNDKKYYAGFEFILERKLKDTSKPIWVTSIDEAQAFMSKIEAVKKEKDNKKKRDRATYERLKKEFGN